MRTSRRKEKNVVEGRIVRSILVGPAVPAPVREEDIYIDASSRYRKRRSSFARTTRRCLLATLLLGGVAFWIYSLLSPIFLEMTLKRYADSSVLYVPLDDHPIPNGNVARRIQYSDERTYHFPIQNLSGRKDIPATAAQGMLEVINALDTVVTIPKGSIFTSKTGVNVLTTLQVTVPASQYPQQSIVAVPAIALSEGSAGNIASGEIETHCPCQLGTVTLPTAVHIRNVTAFTGGQDAKREDSVTPQDLDRVQADHRTTIEQTAKLAIQHRLKANELLIEGSLSCLTMSRSTTGTPLSLILAMRCDAETVNVEEIRGITLRLYQRPSHGNSPVHRLSPPSVEILSRSTTLSIPVKVTSLWGASCTDVESRILPLIKESTPSQAEERVKQQEERVETFRVHTFWLPFLALPSTASRFHFSCISAPTIDKFAMI